MGTVYLCEHTVLQRRFAVKVLRADLVDDAELVDRFRNEAIAASRIGQENVVDVLDFGADDDGSLYYVMEALDGKSLGAVIRDEGPLSVLRALDVLEQLCHALAAAHARGVVHRDVKPDNVFLVRRSDGGERAKVIDFGISRVPGFGERLTRAGAIIGTPEYMAPEQARGAAIDHRADVYAAGVLAFEMLTGELPLEAATPAATIAAHRTRTPDPPSRRIVGVPPEVDALVLRALAKRPEDRFESMDELAAEVARIRSAISREFGGRTTPSDGRAPAPRRSSGPGRPSRPRGETVALPETRDDLRRTRPFRRAGAALAIVAGVLAAVAAGWAWRAFTERGAIAGAVPVPVATPTATLTATPAATPTPTAAPTSTTNPNRPLARGASTVAAPAPALAPLDVATPSGPVLVGAAPRPDVSVLRDEARPARAKTRRPTRRAEDGQEPELKDPYADDAKLKDPF